MHDLGADYWRAKLLAYAHDPAEKALVLFRNPGGHEAGTTARIRSALGFSADEIHRLEPAVREADHWASAADRVSLPRPSGERFPEWAQVRFSKEPELVHPLSADRLRLGDLSEFPFQHVEAVSFDHLATIIEKAGPDRKRQLFALWRNGIELPSEIGALWRLLPADTRIPDHSIWDHLALTSAFAGVLSLGQQPALLTVSLGPVQSFIAQARSTSDLWAGSHLLSRATFEAITAVIDRYGPDTVLFPNLVGLPFLDVWLDRHQIQAPRVDRASDANPLFRAAIPNRFSAIVPRDEVEACADSIRKTVHSFVRRRANDAWSRICDEARVPRGEEATAQIESQLEWFPEVHWAAVPWMEVADLAAGARAFRASDRAGFLDSDSFRLLSGETSWPEGHFYRPNGGTHYPAVFDIAERTLAAAKSLRPFRLRAQEGYRCSLCGEREWLTRDRSHLHHRRGADVDDAWRAIDRPAWVRAGERLCAVCATKRLWPAMFQEEIAFEGRRYVVSTHAMALASTLEALLDVADSPDLRELERLTQNESDATVALPRRLAKRAAKVGRIELVRRVAARFESISDARRDGRSGDESASQLGELERRLAQAAGKPREDYYALVLMDGDRMGAWLSGQARGTDAPGRPAFRRLIHSRTARALDERYGRERGPINDYLDSSHLSPSYHVAVSRALNDLALHVIPAIVEDRFLGKVIYAGGDDLLAMASPAEVLDLVLALRLAYSGIGDEQMQALGAGPLSVRSANGFVHLRSESAPARLHVTMGRNASASFGVVVAHHMTPLAQVLRDLRSAERASKAGSKDAVTITLAKRAGGTTSLTLGFALDRGARIEASPLRVLSRLRASLRASLSRRAAYHLIEWLRGLPDADTNLGREQHVVMLRSCIEHQLQRQRVQGRSSQEEMSALADQMVGAAYLEHDRSARSVTEVLTEMLRTAEFLARDERSGEA
jgi:CRISPR-associated protein Cmr2